MVSRSSEYRPERMRFTTAMNSLVVSCCNDNGCQIVFRGRTGQFIRTSPVWVVSPAKTALNVVQLLMCHKEGNRSRDPLFLT